MARVQLDFHYCGSTVPRQRIEERLTAFAKKWEAEVALFGGLDGLFVEGEPDPSYGPSDVIPVQESGRHVGVLSHESFECETGNWDERPACGILRFFQSGVGIDSFPVWFGTEPFPPAFYRDLYQMFGEQQWDVCTWVSTDGSSQAAEATLTETGLQWILDPYGNDSEPEECLEEPQREYRVGTISSGELARIAGGETDLEGFFQQQSWRERDDIYSATSEPSWNNIAATVPAGTWLQSTVYDSLEDALLSLELLAKKPDGHLYVLKAGHVVDILRTKYPARDGELLVEHFERALTSQIATDDVEFTGSVFGIKRERPKKRT